MRTTTTKKSGMKRIARNVPLSMPPKTLVPMATWAPAPAPVAIARGSTPNPKAIEVMTIGRSRTFAAKRVASTSSIPPSR